MNTRNFIMTAFLVLCALFLAAVLVISIAWLDIFERIRLAVELFSITDLVLFFEQLFTAAMRTSLGVEGCWTRMPVSPISFANAIVFSLVKTIVFMSEAPATIMTATCDAFPVLAKRAFALLSGLTRTVFGIAGHIFLLRIPTGGDAVQTNNTAIAALLWLLLAVLLCIIRSRCSNCAFIEKQAN